MKSNLYGQVGNTKLTSSQGLLPLFEAVINSIQAIEDRQPARGEIKITIQRTPLPSIFEEADHGGPPPAEPIQNFLIVGQRDWFQRRELHLVRNSALPDGVTDRDG